MVSIREIRRIFEDVSPERQLPMEAILQFQTRAEAILESFAKICNLEAGGEDSHSRLTSKHVKLAFVSYSDTVKENENDEFGEWNEEKGDEE